MTNDPRRSRDEEIREKESGTQKAIADTLPLVSDATPEEAEEGVKYLDDKLRESREHTALLRRSMGLAVLALIMVAGAVGCAGAGMKPEDKDLIRREVRFAVEDRVREATVNLVQRVMSEVTPLLGKLELSPEATAEIEGLVKGKLSEVSDTVTKKAGEVVDDKVKDFLAKIPEESPDSGGWGGVLGGILSTVLPVVLGAIRKG